MSSSSKQISQTKLHRTPYLPLSRDPLLGVISLPQNPLQSVYSPLVFKQSCMEKDSTSITILKGSQTQVVSMDMSLLMKSDRPVRRSHTSVDSSARDRLLLNSLPEDTF